MLHLVGSYQYRVTMHGTMNMKFSFIPGTIFRDVRNGWTSTTRAIYVRYLL